MLAAQKAEHEAEMARRRAALTSATEAAYLAMTSAEAQRLERQVQAAAEANAAADEEAAASRAAGLDNLRRYAAACVPRCLCPQASCLVQIQLLCSVASGRSVACEQGQGAFRVTCAS